MFTPFDNNIYGLCVVSDHSPWFINQYFDNHHYKEKRVGRRLDIKLIILFLLDVMLEQRESSTKSKWVELENFCGLFTARELLSFNNNNKNF